MYTLLSMVFTLYFHPLLPSTVQNPNRPRLQLQIPRRGGPACCFCSFWAIIDVIFVVSAHFGRSWRFSSLKLVSFASLIRTIVGVDVLEVFTFFVITFPALGEWAWVKNKCSLKSNRIPTILIKHGNFIMRNIFTIFYPWGFSNSIFKKKNGTMAHWVLWRRSYAFSSVKSIWKFDFQRRKISLQGSKSAELHKPVGHHQ